MMPGFDGTGPRGMGPMTGGGRGYCALGATPPAAQPYRAPVVPGPLVSGPVQGAAFGPMRPAVGMWCRGRGGCGGGFGRGRGGRGGW